jgi:hypothetical protein
LATTPLRIDHGRRTFGLRVREYTSSVLPEPRGLACDSTPAVLHHNNHDGTFTDVAVSAGVGFNEDGREQAGMGTTVADYDWDGHLDIFKTNFSEDTSTLHHHKRQLLKQTYQ